MNEQKTGRNKINLRRLKPFGMVDNECELKSAHYTLHICTASVCILHSYGWLIGWCLKDREAQQIEYGCGPSTIFVSNEVSFSLVFVRFSVNSSFHFMHSFYFSFFAPQIQHADIKQTRLFWFIFCKLYFCQKDNKWIWEMK